MWSLEWWEKVIHMISLLNQMQIIGRHLYINLATARAEMRDEPTEQWLRAGRRQEQNAKGEGVALASSHQSAVAVHGA